MGSYGVKICDSSSQFVIGCKVRLLRCVWTCDWWHATHLWPNALYSSPVITNAIKLKLKKDMMEYIAGIRNFCKETGWKVTNDKVTRTCRWPSSCCTGYNLQVLKLKAIIDHHHKHAHFTADINNLNPWACLRLVSKTWCTFFWTKDLYSTLSLWRLYFYPCLKLYHATRREFFTQRKVT